MTDKHTDALDALRELVAASEAMTVDCVFCADIVGWDEGDACAEHIGIVAPLARARAILDLGEPPRVATGEEVNA